MATPILGNQPGSGSARLADPTGERSPGGRSETNVPHAVTFGSTALGLWRDHRRRDEGRRHCEALLSRALHVRSVGIGVRGSFYGGRYGSAARRGSAGRFADRRIPPTTGIILEARGLAPDPEHDRAKWGTR